MFRTLVFALLALPVTASAAKPKIAAMEIRAERGVDPGLARLLDEVLLSELSGDFDVIGKSDITAMLGFEQQKQILGCSEEASCLAEIGGALGVGSIVTGNLGQMGKLYLINLKLMDAAQAKVIKRVSETVSGSEDALVAGLQRAVGRLFDAKDDGRAARANPAIAAAESPSVPPKDSRSNALNWVGVGLGSLTMVAGFAVGLSALGTSGDIKENLLNPSDDGSHLGRDTELRSQLSRQSWTANGLVAGGIAIAVTSFLLRDTDDGSGSDGPVLVPTLDGVALAGVLP